jgi:DNA-binding transcriptional ArsR family regulator
MANEQTVSPTVEWDFGTAYELFISLHVLHNTEYFGIRASWAAGVRSRIPSAERKLLEDIFPFFGVPMNWLHSLPAPKDAISALWTLKQLPPAERMPTLLRLEEDCASDGSPEAEQKRLACETLKRIARDGAWTAADADLFQKMWSKESHPQKRESLERVLDWWSRPTELGELALSALQSYYQAFFEDEEKRVTPLLQAGLRRAKELAASLTVDELFHELSQGVQMGEEFRAAKYIFVPAFWTTPLILYEKLDADTMLITFGARPADVSVIPGETLPDGLVRSLKALADPTRLKILAYLSHESLTPSELARRLQLRAPTVTHHLSDLRLASLVDLSMEHGDKRYSIRKEGLDSTFANLTNFLESK